MAIADSTTDFDSEVWKPVIGYETVYEVSNLGRVRRLPNNKWSYVPMLSPWKNRNGYRQVTLSRKPKRHHPYVHLLVWTSFVGPIPDGLQINHKDLNKDNNRLDNLEMLTRQENVTHATLAGAQKPRRGSLNGHSKLTEDQVREIRSLRGAARMHPARELSIQSIGRMYNTDPSNIALILKRKTWFDI